MIPTRFRRLPSLRATVPWVAVAAVAAVVALTVVLPDRGARRRPATAPAGLPPVEEPAFQRARADLRPVATPPPASDPGGPWGRRVIRQATVEVELDDVERAIARLTDLVEAAGGYVADTHVHGDDKGAARATVTAYVPPPAFSGALGEFERLGRVRTRRVTGQDVSEEFVDLEARVRNLERHEAQLLTFMGRAQKVADLVSLENELARVRGEIERLSGRLRFLRARTEMAGIQVNLLRGTAPAPADGAWARVWQAFLAGWKAAFDAAVGLAAVAAQVSPLAVPAALGWAVYRRFRRPSLTTSQP